MAWKLQAVNLGDERRRLLLAVATLTLRRWLRTNAFDGHADELDRVDRAVFARGHVVDRIDHLHAVDDGAKDRILSVPWADAIDGHEELATAGVRFSGIGDGELARGVEAQAGKDFIVDMDSAAVVTNASGVAGLDHLVADHAMERDAVVKAALHWIMGFRVYRFLHAVGEVDERTDGAGSVFLEEACNKCALGCMECGVESVSAARGGGRCGVQ